jgi:hypothetical protein
VAVKAEDGGGEAGYDGFEAGNGSDGGVDPCVAPKDALQQETFQERYRDSPKLKQKIANRVERKDR